jgi:alpha-L-rhamnosidase
MTTLTPTSLRCEYRVDPLGIDVSQPRLSWIVTSDARNQIQTAYRVVVAENRETLGDDPATLWDSGRVKSDQTTAIYAGQPLKSRQRAYWKVRVWDRDGRDSDWSLPSFWVMGLLEPEDWRVQWVGYDEPYAAVCRSGHLATGSSLDRSLVKMVRLTARAFRGCTPAFVRKAGRSIVMRIMHFILTRKVTGFKPVFAPCPFLRKEFVCRTPVRATLYSSALGLYEIHINGNRVGEDYLTPGWTDYHRRVYYQTYDVTSLLHEGRNAIGAILSDGWYSGYVGPGGKRCWYGIHPRLAIQLEIEYRDGPTTIVTTDSTWRAVTGPLREADLLMGETYDAQAELTGWSRAGHDDAAWSPVSVTQRVEGRLQAMPHIGVRKTAEIKPVLLTEPKSGRYVYDMGRNFAGWARLKVEGEAGTRVTLRFAERLDRDGTIYTANLRWARATDTYILKGAGIEEWEPRFTYHGFQYVELTGYPGTPDIDTLTGIVIQSAISTAGWFECSNDLVNALHENITWTQRANFIDIPTDCPQRDERLGWLGDAQVFARTAMYNMDVASFFSKWLRDLADARSAGGAYPDFAPRGPVAQDGAPGWADAGIICPWTLYMVYGDTRIVEMHYDAMKNWVEHIRDGNPDLLWTRRTGGDNGDWLALDDGTPRPVLATAYFAHSTSLLAKMAAAIGRAQDADTYKRLSEAVKDAFNRAYVGADGRVTGDTQTCYVLSLGFDLLPVRLRPQAARWLVQAIERANGHLSTGFFGTACLAPALTAHGYVDIVYRLLLNETFPSWGYSIRHGATSVWERWDGWTEEKGFADPSMNSFSHCAFGSIGEWLFTTVAGIDTDGPGFRRIVIRPQPGGGLTYARAQYDSINGCIRTHWLIEGASFHLQVAIPANTTALIFLPTHHPESVTEEGSPVARAGDIEIAWVEEKAVVLRVGSGHYQFRADLSGFTGIGPALPTPPR